MDRSRQSPRGMKAPPLRPHAPPKTAEERQSLLSFYQRYSYRDGPRDSIVNGNLPPPPNATGSWQRTKTYLTADVSTRWADLVLMVCFFISGLVDSGAYNAYSCFVSMQVSRSLHVHSAINGVDPFHLQKKPSLTHPLDRQHYLPRPRSELPPRRHARSSLDEIAHSNHILPLRRGIDILLPPSLRRAQTLGPRCLIRVPDASNRHRRNPRALRIIK
jgi:hypothetical protein